MQIVYHAAGGGDNARGHPLRTGQVVSLGDALRAGDRDLDRSGVGGRDGRPAFGLDLLDPLAPSAGSGQALPS